MGQLKVAHRERTEYNRLWRQANREKVNARKRLDREKNKEKISAQQKAWYAANAEKVRAKVTEYRNSNLDDVRARDRRYQAEHRDEISRKRRVQWPEKHAGMTESQLRRRAALQQDYRARNTEKANEATQQWRANNPEAVRRGRQEWYAANPGRQQVYNLQRRFRQEQRTPAWADIDELVRFYRGRPKGFAVDHIVPLLGITAEGYMVSGLHVPWNLQYLTKPQNSAKRNRMREQDAPLASVLSANEWA